VTLNSIQPTSIFLMFMNPNDDYTFWWISYPVVSNGFKTN
jgi:hypothetical protein